LAGARGEWKGFGLKRWSGSRARIRKLVGWKKKCTIPMASEPPAAESAIIEGEGWVPYLK
jgi:hypothetical protein